MHSGAQLSESGGSGLYWVHGHGELAGRRARAATPLRLSMVRIFRHYVPVQLLLLALLEASIFFGAIYLGISLRFEASEMYLIKDPVWPQGLVFAFVMLTSMTALGLYTREVPKGNWSYYAKFVASFFLGWVATTLVFYLYPDLFLGRGVFGIEIGRASCRERV